jgi:hypothetical protein
MLEAVTAAEVDDLERQAAKGFENLAEMDASRFEMRGRGVR